MSTTTSQTWGKGREAEVQTVWKEFLLRRRRKRIMIFLRVGGPREGTSTPTAGTLMMIRDRRHGRMKMKINHQSKEGS